METKNQIKKGILAKPKHEKDTTKFKLICWYAEKPNGEYYSEIEKLQNKNRKYHDSIDFILTPGGYVTRHDIALEKLTGHVNKYRSKIINAWLLMNDFINDTQYLIGKYQKDESKDLFIQPEFKLYNKSETKQTAQGIVEFNLNHVFATSLIIEPLQTFKLKYHENL